MRTKRGKADRGKDVEHIGKKTFRYRTIEMINEFKCSVHRGLGLLGDGASARGEG